MLPALVSLVVVLPLLGGGLFGLALGAGPLPIIGNVLLHVVYGAILGVVYGPWGDLDASTLERPDIRDGGVAGPSYEPVAALALLIGLVVGGLRRAGGQHRGGRGRRLAARRGERRADPLGRAARRHRSACSSARSPASVGPRRRVQTSDRRPC